MSIGAVLAPLLGRGNQASHAKRCLRLCPPETLVYEGVLSLPWKAICVLRHLSLSPWYFPSL